VKKTTDTSANKETEKIPNPLLLNAIADIREKGGEDIVFSDFAPDPLSGELSGFMTGPLRDNTEAMIGYVGARISPDRISEILQQRQGLGKTGTSYLMGADQTIRCAAYPDDPATAGNAAPAKITVNIESAGDALSGKTGQRMTLNDKNNRMISAYAPVKAGNLVWALIVEISADEAYGQLEHINMLIIITMIIALIMGLTVALLLSRSIQSEISATMAGMESLSRKEQIEKFEGLMHEASNMLEFEKAAFYRDKISALKGQRFSP
jgi:methyl-accepting chemotaxis protein